VGLAVALPPLRLRPAPVLVVVQAQGDEVAPKMAASQRDVVVAVLQLYRFVAAVSVPA